MDNYERHYLSGIYGNMPGDEFAALKSNIEENGFMDPIIMVYEGEILDGWHRYRVAKELNIVDQLNFQEVDSDDPASYAIGKNLTRRHLNKTLSAILVAESYNWTNGLGEKRKAQLDDNALSLVTKPDAALCHMAGCERGTIATAKAIILAGLSNQVKTGDLTIAAAVDKIKSDAQAKKLAIKKKEAEDKLAEQNRAIQARKEKLETAQRIKDMVNKLEIEEEELVSFADKELSEAEEELETEQVIFEEVATEAKEIEREVDMKTGSNDSDIHKVVTISRNDFEEVEFNVFDNSDLDILSELTLFDIESVINYLDGRLISETKGYKDLTDLQKNIVGAIHDKSSQDVIALRSLIDSKLRSTA